MEKMLPKVKLFPLVTLSREVFLQYILKVCRDAKLAKGRELTWIEQVKEKMSRGHYFEGMIYMESRSLYVFLHELIHHIAWILRGYAQSKRLYIIDSLIDEFDIWLFNKDKKRKFLIHRA